jgi:NADPH-dependent curcumin reductase CurA
MPLVDSIVAAAAGAAGVVVAPAAMARPEVPSKIAIATGATKFFISNS